ncbi:MAG TPA: hypothetical protein VK447_06000 [Myxococcaceae bacterium]|nr:hypothetical protein [Myxococcaceae bacterium]
MPRLLLLLPLLASLMSSTSHAEAPKKEAGKPLEILFIGNSYTFFNELPEMVTALARAAGVRPLHTRQVTVGGATLAQHWGEGKGDGVRAIDEHHPDLVVLQDQSQLPRVSPEVFQHFARLFDERIRAGGARTLLYVTWARKDAPGDQEALTAAYTAVARERKATLVPVGPVWQAIRKAMPALSLHDADGSHPSPLGSYVAALTFFAVIYERSPEGLPTKLGLSEASAVNITPELATALQKIVWSVVNAPKP